MTVNDNNNDNPNRTIYTIKDTKLYVPVVTLSLKTTKNYRNFLASDLKDQYIGMTIKQKVRIKIQNMNIDIFLKQTLQELTDCFFWFIQTKIIMLKELMPKIIIYQNIKNCNVIINGKNFYDQPTDSDVKWFEEIRKLTTGQGEDYTARCLLDYEYIKNQYRLIAVYWSKQKEFDVDPKAIQQIELVGQLKKLDAKVMLQMQAMMNPYFLNGYFTK